MLSRIPRRNNKSGTKSAAAVTGSGILAINVEEWTGRGIVINIMEVSLTGDILEKIRNLDLAFYPTIYDIGWYLARYKPWHSAFAAMDDEKMIGYFVVVPVRKELYDAILNGVLVDDLGINPDMYLKESEYYYAVSVVIQEAYRGRKIGRQLFDAYFSRYPDKKTCLLAVSRSGYRLAEHYFSLVKRISENVAVFVSQA